VHLPKLARALVMAQLAVLLAGAAVAPARADVLILTNGDLLVGQLETASLPVVTPDGTLQVGAQELLEVRFATLGGDVMHYRSGRALTGSVDAPGLALRLPSGQTVVVERGRLSALRFRAR
jgi:hypothetical protein